MSLLSGLARLVVALLRLVVSVVNWFTLPAHHLRHEEPDETVLPPELTMLPATELARRLRRREVLSRDLVSQSIEQIMRVNPWLNAIVADRFADALSEAEKADAELDRLREQSKGDVQQPFLGVPVVIKECFAVEGFAQTSGVLERRNAVARADADAVHRLRKAGFIIVGLSNLSEICLWWESSNPVHGRTGSPYSSAHSSGGSSGGSAAIVGAHGAPVALGSSIGGSIGMPAFFCGVCGHTPTPGLVSNEGQYPISANNDIAMLRTGPITRHACDLLPVLNVLSSTPVKECAVDFATLRVLSLETLGAWLVESTSRELVLAQRRCVAHFRALGAQNVDLDPGTLPHLGEAVALYFAAMEISAATTGKDSLQSTGGHREASWLRFLANAALGRHSLPAVMLGLAEAVTAITPPSVNAAMAKRIQALRGAVLAVLGDDGVLLMPSHPRTAYPHRHPLASPFNFLYTGLVNALELPSTQVPLGLSRESGHPLGIQIVGPPGSDAKLIACAESLEARFRGHVSPFLC